MMGAIETSVIIPVYNVEEHLDRCLRSCLEQTMPFDEIILIDDGSTDGSGAICDDYAARYASIKVFHQENAGLGAARNKGIMEAQGNRIAFLDSDDWLHPEYLRKLYGIMEDNDADIAMCDFVRTTDDADFERACPSNGPERILSHRADDFLDIMLRVKGNRAVHYAWNKLYRREVLEVDHFPTGVYNEDVEGCFKALINADTIVETNMSLYAYRVNPDSITGRRFGENYLNLREVWLNIERIAKARKPEVSDKVHYNVLRADFTVLCDMLIHGDRATDQRYESDRERIQERLNANLGQLMRGSMALNRKAFTLIVAKAYRPIRSIMRSVRRR